MYRLLTVIGVVLVASPAGAQQYQRRATMVGGGGGDRGKCTIEVVVDGAADVEIRGDQGVIKNISGRPAEWRRFECSAPLPANPADFRFAGIDGRGRQQLARDPRNGGVAVVRIEDSNGGSEGYTFDLIWGGNNNPGNTLGRGPEGYNPAPGRDDRGPGGYVPPPGADNRYPEHSRDRMSRSFTTEQAVNVCQDSVRRQARNRFPGRHVEFLNTRIDDNPDRNDWVVGTLDVIRGRDISDGRYRFSCSVNFDSGQVRSAQIDTRRSSGGGR